MLAIRGPGVHNEATHQRDLLATRDIPVRDLQTWAGHPDQSR